MQRNKVVIVLAIVQNHQMCMPLSPFHTHATLHYSWHFTFHFTTQRVLTSVLVVVWWCVLLRVFVCGMRMLLHSCHCVTCNSLRKPHQSAAFSTCEKCFCICFGWHTFRLSIHIDLWLCACSNRFIYNMYTFFCLLSSLSDTIFTGTQTQTQIPQL